MTRRLPRDLLLVHLLCALVVGVLWWRLSPELEYTVVEGTPYTLDEVQTGEVVAADGVFALLGLAAGVLCAAVLLLRRYGGPWLSVGLAVGGLLGSGAAWALGTWLGPGRLADLAGAAANQEVVVPGPELAAYGVLLVWPITAVVVALVAAWLTGPPPRPAPPSPR
jgi:hypothetical protein